MKYFGTQTDSRLPFVRVSFDPFKLRIIEQCSGQLRLLPLVSDILPQIKASLWYWPSKKKKRQTEKCSSFLVILFRSGVSPDVSSVWEEGCSDEEVCNHTVFRAQRVHSFIPSEF